MKTLAQAAVISVVVAAMVGYNIYSYTKTPRFMDFPIPSFSPQKNEAGSGTGYFVNPTTIITDAHVTDGSESIKIQLPTGEVVDGKVLVQDKDVDLSAIVIEKPFKGRIPLCVQGNMPRYGDFVSSMGFGLIYDTGGAIDYHEGTVVGMVSGFMRDAFVGMPGDSGSPIMREHGCVEGNLHAVHVFNGQAVNGISIDSAPKVLKNFLDRNHIVYSDHRSVYDFFHTDAERLYKGIVRIANIQLPKETLGDLLKKLLG